MAEPVNILLSGDGYEIGGEDGDRFVWTVQYRIYVRDINEVRLSDKGHNDNIKTSQD